MQCRPPTWEVIQLYSLNKIFTVSENLKMSPEDKIKCTHYNSGFCKFKKKETGCKFFHPEKTCERPTCKDKNCSYRHPKPCKFGDTCLFQNRCSYKHLKPQQNDENVLITSTTREVDELRAEIAKLKEENYIKINLQVKVQYKELEELRNKNTSLINHVNVNFRQYEVDLKLKESELKEAIKKIGVLENEKVESLSKVNIAAETFKFKVKQLETKIEINNARIESKDNEIIKDHQVIDTKDREFRLKEAELTAAFERIRVLEEEPIELPYELVKEIDTLKLEVEHFKQRLQVTQVKIYIKDDELTISYGIIDNFKQDMWTLTEQLEILKSLRH